MKEYFYMFSSGSYSDYCVGGLYKSKEKFDYKFFADYVREMLLDQCKNWPEACEYISNINGDDAEDSLSSLTNKYSIQVALFSLEAGPQPHPADRERSSVWNSDFYKWIKESGNIDVDFIAKLVKEGLLEIIEYEEIWNGDNLP